MLPRIDPDEASNEPHWERERKRERRFHLSDVHSRGASLGFAREIRLPSPQGKGDIKFMREEKRRESGITLAQGPDVNSRSLYRTILSGSSRRRRRRCLLHFHRQRRRRRRRCEEHLRFAMRINAENDRVRSSSDRHTNGCQADDIPYQPNGDIALAAADAPRSLAAVVATLIVRQKRYQAGARPRTPDAPPVTAQAVPGFRFRK